MRFALRRLVVPLVALVLASSAALAVPVVGAGAAPENAAVPVVLIPGWHGDPASFDALIPQLQRAGRVVLNFDPSRGGVHALAYEPTVRADGEAEHIPWVAAKIVQPAIEAALARAGYGPRTHIDIVAHSMGGLMARFLIEHPGARVGHFSPERGWYGAPSDPPDVEGDWAARVDHLVMLGTPNHGTPLALVPAALGLTPTTAPLVFGKWNATGADMEPGSPFLSRMGTTAPCSASAAGGPGSASAAGGPGSASAAGGPGSPDGAAGLDGCPRYTAIGGAPPYLRLPIEDDDGDGVAHGFDGVVPSESPFLAGDVHYLVPANHAGLTRDPRAVALVLDSLDHRSAGSFTWERPLVGDLAVHLDHVDITTSTGRFAASGYRFALSVDPAGGGRETVPAGTVTDHRHGKLSATWAPGDHRADFTPVRLDGRSPRIDLRLDVTEPALLGEEVVATALFDDIAPGPGGTRYEATVPLPGGRHDTFDITVSGVGRAA